MTSLEIVLEYLPITIKNKIEKFLKDKEDKDISPKEENIIIEEIRLRSCKPMMLKTEKEIIQIDYIVQQYEILQAFERICENSIYSYRRQICNGYITIRGGNRVGIVGSAVIDNGQVININYISSLNFRIARQKIGCSNFLMKEIINTNNTIANTLIVSPPGCGKTTLLRDIVRNISNGIKEIDFKGKNVGVIDERGEIAAMCKGIAQNDIGIRTDVIDNMPKPEAIRILVRSMAPDIIVCDEIGSIEDVKAIDYAMCCGVKGIFSAHGNSLEEINLNSELSKLMDKHIFERIILLNPEKRGDARCIYL